MWFTILRSYTYSRDASCKAIISEWLVEVDTKVFFENFQDIVVPPCKKTKSVYDLPLWESNR
jgi:hypothetical protein